MPGIFVKLDAEYPSDDEFIEAGPMAELLYIRGLCFCKRKRLDGVITTRQLAAVAHGIRNRGAAVRALIETGLWVETDDGWSIPAWLKHNKTAAEITADQQAKTRASIEGNHAQHHVGPGKKPSYKCPICRENGAPKSEPKSEPVSSQGGLQEEEPEEEPQPQPEPSIGSVVRDDLEGAVDNWSDDPRQRRTQLITAEANARADARADTIKSRGPYIAKVIREIERDYGQTLTQYVLKYPKAPNEAIADRVFNENLTRDLDQYQGGDAE